MNILSVILAIVVFVAVMVVSEWWRSRARKKLRESRDPHLEDSGSDGASSTE